MTSTAQTIAESALQATAALAATDPKAAALIALAPIALQLLESITAMQQAGTVTSADVAAMFAQIGANVQANHAQWLAMNAADAASAP